MLIVLLRSEGGTVHSNLGVPCTETPAPAGTHDYSLMIQGTAVAGLLVSHKLLTVWRNSAQVDVSNCVI